MFRLRLLRPTTAFWIQQSRGHTFSVQFACYVQEAMKCGSARSPPSRCFCPPGMLVAQRWKVVLVTVFSNVNLHVDFLNFLKSGISDASPCSRFSPRIHVSIRADRRLRSVVAHVAIHNVSVLAFTVTVSYYFRLFTCSLQSSLAVRFHMP